MVGTGRNEVPLRFTRHSNIYSIDEFSDPTILKIFGTEISWHFKEIPENFKPFKAKDF
jgi:hypothetical protein